MSGFSTDWLALRKPADEAARARTVLEACRTYFANRSALTVCDVGAGTGAAIAAFGPYIPPKQHWILVDSDPASLEEARRNQQVSGASLETRIADLADNPAPWPHNCGLVTATALFDLANSAWIARVCDRLAADRLPLLATLTYDGHQEFVPFHASDAEMLEAFNRHQRLDKGLGGPAAGPEGASLLAAALRKRGYRPILGNSPWRLSASTDSLLIAATLRAWTSAVTEAGFVDPALANDWLAARLFNTQAFIVGHTDLFAAPPVR